MINIGKWMWLVGSNAIMGMVLGYRVMDTQNGQPYHGLLYTLGMVTAILLFVVIFTLFEIENSSGYQDEFQAALESAIKIKAGLQGITLLLLLSNTALIIAAPDFLIGAYALSVVEEDLTIRQALHPFWFSFSAAMITAIIFSLIVFIIAACIYYIRVGRH